MIPRRQFYLFFFHSCRDHPALHSFPTRRSSDLEDRTVADDEHLIAGIALAEEQLVLAQAPLVKALRERRLRKNQRSEEHTSELQSHSDLVCRLLLEKKKHSIRLVCVYSS